MVDNKQNEAKPYRKRPTIGFFPLDAFLCYYRMISVNAKKKEMRLGEGGRCLQPSADAQSPPQRPTITVHVYNYRRGFPPSVQTIFKNRMRGCVIYREYVIPINIMEMSSLSTEELT